MTPKKKKKVRKKRTRNIFTVEQRSENLLFVYKRLLEVITGKSLSQDHWQTELKDILLTEEDAEDEQCSKESGSRMNLPKLIDPYKKQGTVDYMWYFFPPNEDYKEQTGIWFVCTEYAWESITPEFRGLEEHCKDDHPQVMVYLWSNKSRIRGEDRWAREGYFSSFSRLLQTRKLEWLWEGEPDWSYPRRKISKKADSLDDVGLLKDFMDLKGRDYSDKQRRSDEYLRQIVRHLKKQK